MATVDGLKKARMLAIEAASIVSGLVDGAGQLILTTQGGTPINAGNVRGPTGNKGSSIFQAGDTIPTTPGGTVVAVAVVYPPGVSSANVGDLIIDSAGTLGIVTTAGANPTVTFQSKMFSRGGTTYTGWAYGVNGIAYGGGYSVPTVKINRDGLVTVTGLLKVDAANAAGVALMTGLPVPVPAGALIFAGMGASNASLRLDLIANGNLSTTTALAANAYVTLSGITYYTNPPAL